MALLRRNGLCAEYVKEAVAEDNAGNYQTAFEKYKIALEYFGTHLKYEKNARARETITAKVGPLCKVPWTHSLSLSSHHNSMEQHRWQSSIMTQHGCHEWHRCKAGVRHLQFKEYLERAEYIKSLLDGQQPAEPSANGATGQKMKPGGGGGDKDVSASPVQAMPSERLE